MDPSKDGMASLCQPQMLRICRSRQDRYKIRCLKPQGENVNLVNWGTNKANKIYYLVKAC